MNRAEDSDQLHRGVTQGDAFMCGSRPQTDAPFPVWKDTATTHMSAVNEHRPTHADGSKHLNHPAVPRQDSCTIVTSAMWGFRPTDSATDLLSPILALSACVRTAPSPGPDTPDGRPRKGCDGNGHSRQDQSAGSGRTDRRGPSECTESARGAETQGNLDGISAGGRLPAGEH